MGAIFNCLSCGHAATDAELGVSGATAPCPKCGRSMYKARGGSAGPASPAVEKGEPRRIPALPSRYAGAVPGASPFEEDDEDDDRNPVILLHTPFVVILGFIFSLVPLACFAGVVISILGYRLVADSRGGLRGKGLAIAGMAIGGAMSLFTVILMMQARS